MLLPKNVTYEEGGVKLTDIQLKVIFDNNKVDKLLLVKNIDGDAFIVFDQIYMKLDGYDFSDYILVGAVVDKNGVVTICKTIRKNALTDAHNAKVLVEESIKAWSRIEVYENAGTPFAFYEATEAMGANHRGESYICGRFYHWAYNDNNNTIWLHVEPHKESNISKMLDNRHPPRMSYETAVKLDELARKQLAKLEELVGFARMTIDICDINK